MRSLAHLSAILVIIAGMAGCVAGSPNSRYTLVDFVDDLHAAGATVESTSDQNIDHGFSIPGRRIVVGGANIYVYEFADAQQAFTASSGVSPDGFSITRTVGTITTMRHSDWIEPPHFYRKGQLIVIYVGRDSGMRGLLQSLLGPQFAGSETNFRGQ